MKKIHKHNKKIIRQKTFGRQTVLLTKNNLLPNLQQLASINGSLALSVTTTDGTNQLRQQTSVIDALIEDKMVI